MRREHSTQSTAQRVRFFVRFNRNVDDAVVAGQTHTHKHTQKGWTHSLSKRERKDVSFEKDVTDRKQMKTN